MQCYKHDPSDIEVIEWVAGYLIDMKLPERAIPFYERGAVLQPNDVRWPMMTAACHRKVGNYTQAIEEYQGVYKKDPDNIVALQQLVRLAKDMGIKEARQYAEELMKLERSLEKESARLGSDSGPFGSNDDRLSTGSSGRPVTNKSMEAENFEDDGFPAFTVRNNSFGLGAESFETDAARPAFSGRPKTAKPELDDLFDDVEPIVLPTE